MLTLIRGLGRWLEEKNRAAFLALLARMATSAQRPSTRPRATGRRACGWGWSRACLPRGPAARSACSL